MRQVRKADTKRCPRCEEWKPLEAFAPNRAMADGRAAYCRPCKRAGERDRARGVKGRPPMERMPKEPPPASEGAPVSGPPEARKPARNLGGRPTKLTPELIDQVVEELEEGFPLSVAAARVCVGESTLRRWLQDGREEDGSQLEKALVMAVQAASAVGHRKLVRTLVQAAEIDPNQARWLLERRWPEDWGRRDVLTVSNEEKPADLQMLREVLGKRIDALVAARAVEAPPPEEPKA